MPFHPGSRFRQTLKSLWYLNPSPFVGQMHAQLGLLHGYAPTEPGKPWRRLDGTSFLDGSPASAMDGRVLGNCWASWECAAVQVRAAFCTVPRPCVYLSPPILCK